MDRSFAQCLAGFAGAFTLTIAAPAFADEISKDYFGRWVPKDLSGIKREICDGSLSDTVFPVEISTHGLIGRGVRCTLQEASAWHGVQEITHVIMICDPGKHVLDQLWTVALDGDQVSWRWLPTNGPGGGNLLEKCAGN